MISRSLVHQSEKLAGLSQDDQNARVIAQAQPLRDVLPSVAATSGGTEVRDGQAQGFRAFAPPKQPSFPDAQTWVASKPRRSHAPDNAGCIPPGQPSFPQGQAGPPSQPQRAIPPPQPQAHKAVTPTVGPELAPHTPQHIPPEATLANLEPPPADGEVLCLETQPNRIAALIAQKRAANEANRRREVWTRQQVAHRISSQAPDDQLLNELNSAAGDSAKGPSSAGIEAGRAGTGQHQAVRNLDQYATPTPVITFDPIVPSTGIQADSRKTSHVKEDSADNKEPTRGPTSAPATKATKEISSRDHESRFSLSSSTTPSPDERSQAAGRQTQDPQQQPNQHGSFAAPVSAPASSAPPIDANFKSISSNSAKHKSKSRYPDASFARQPNQSNHSTPVAAGYYRFKPKHWQTNSSTQPEHQQQIQALSPATPSGYQRLESSTWPASRDLPQKTPPNPVFRNLTQDRFGRFGVGGKLKEALGQPSGAGA